MSKALIFRIGSIIIGLFLLVVIISYLAGSWETKIEPGVIPAASTSVPEDLLTLTARTEPVVERAPGTVRARDETTISARIVAPVVTIGVRAGDSVERGDVIARLDDRDFVARLEQARQNAEAVEARLSDAVTERDRARTLVAQGAMAQAELDRLDALTRAVTAELESARRSIDEAETTLSFTVIEAPIDGRVIDRYVESGDMVSPGVPIVRLYDPASMRLEADVRESVATQLARGDRLAAHIDALGSQFPVTIEEVVPQSDAGSRTFLIKASLPSSESLYPGMFGRLLIERGVEQRLYIPSPALARVGQLEFVYVVEDGKVLRRHVRTGRKDAAGNLEILTGLREGEQIAATASAARQD